MKHSKKSKKYPFWFNPFIITIAIFILIGFFHSITRLINSPSSNINSSLQPTTSANDEGGNTQTTVQERIQKMRSLGIPDNQIEEALIRTGQIKTNADFKKLVETIPISPTPQPSERALKAASYAYPTMSEEEQKNMKSNYINSNNQYVDIVGSKGTPYKKDAQGNVYSPDLEWQRDTLNDKWIKNSKIDTDVVRNFALALDKDLTWLVQWETWIEGDKIAKSRPVYVQQQSPSVDIRCTSNINYSGTSIDTTCR